MKTTLTDNQIQQYRNDGFIHIPGFLSQDEVATLKGAVLEATASMGSRRVAGDATQTQEDKDIKNKYYVNVFTQRLNLWKINETAKSFMLSPEIGKMICRLEGIEGIRVWHDQALIKEPYGNATGWHLDNPYWSFHSHHSASIWIALEDATPLNGCMCFVPGSHKIGKPELNSGIGQNMGDLFKLYPEMTKTDPVAVPMKAGDCSFHNGLTAHGAGANMTRGRRIAMTCAYMPEGSTFNGHKNILPEDYFKSLKVGDVLENDAHNPLIYSSRKLAAAYKIASTTSLNRHDDSPSPIPCPKTGKCCGRCQAWLFPETQPHPPPRVQARRNFMPGMKRTGKIHCWRSRKIWMRTSRNGEGRRQTCLPA